MHLPDTVKETHADKIQHLQGTMSEFYLWGGFVGRFFEVCSLKHNFRIPKTLDWVQFNKRKWSKYDGKGYSRDKPAIRMHLVICWSRLELTACGPLCLPCSSWDFCHAEHREKMNKKTKQKIKEALRSDDILVIPLSFLHCAAPPQSKGGCRVTMAPNNSGTVEWMSWICYAS